MPDNFTIYKYTVQSAGQGYVSSTIKYVSYEREKGTFLTYEDVFNCIGYKYDTIKVPELIVDGKKYPSRTVNVYPDSLYLKYLILHDNSFVYGYERYRESSM